MTSKRSGIESNARMSPCRTRCCRCPVRASCVWRTRDSSGSGPPQARSNPGSAERWRSHAGLCRSRDKDSGGPLRDTIQVGHGKQPAQDPGDGTRKRVPFGAQPSRIGIGFVLGLHGTGYPPAVPVNAGIVERRRRSSMGSRIWRTASECKGVGARSAAICSLRQGDGAGDSRRIARTMGRDRLTGRSCRAHCVEQMPKPGTFFVRFLVHVLRVEALVCDRRNDRNGSDGSAAGCFEISLSVARRENASIAPGRGREYDILDQAQQ